MKNVLLISLDGLRADVAYSGKFKNLNRIIRESTVFDKVVAQAPLTPVSHATVLSGMYPSNHGIRHLFVEQMFDEVRTLPMFLKEKGYVTHAVVSCPGLNRWYGFSRGFDSFDDQVPKGPDGREALYTVDVQARGRAAKKADEVVQKAVRLLSRFQRDPFFLFLHFFDAHWPYEPPQPFLEQFRENPYEGEVAYIDHNLGILFEEMDRKGLWKDLVMVIMADHGEDMAGLYPNDHSGDLGHPEESGHGCLLYDVTQLVPLMFRTDGDGLSGHRIEQQVRLVDVTPTILELLAIEIDVPFDGLSLVPHMRGQRKDLVGYCETHYPRENASTLEKYSNLRNLKAVRIRDNGMEYKVIWHLDSDVVEVYNLTEDPKERRNLI